ncbi:MAG: GNAT family N-acetyltransferase [Calditrichaeota bacterium]|nr:GNAT family N-acetyltransferase [Calditrichota bacterium]MCB9369460.1 GNAT family N-acetyltransferase [Calditrichota bacterium]
MIVPPPSERIRFAPLTLDYLDVMCDLHGDAEVMRHYPNVFTREETQQWIERSLARMERDGHSFYALESLETGEFLGQCGILLQEVEGVFEAEVGYLLMRKHWHKGYATEAARHCRDFARSRFCYKRVISLISPENIPSQNVAKRLGAGIEKRIIKWDLPHDVWLHV